MVFTNFGVQYPFVKNLVNNKTIRHAIYRRCKNIKYFSRHFSDKFRTSEAPFVPFQENVKIRRREASRSILIGIQSEQCLLDLHTYCSQLGKVNKFIPCIESSNPSRLVIVEFNNASNVNEILSSATVDNYCPVRSPFVTYNNKKFKKRDQLKKAEAVLNNLQIKLENCKSVSEQMVTLHNAYKLNDFHTRLRYLVGHQIETSITGMFPNARAHLFGSSVNGYGKIGSDLDIVLRFFNDKIGERNKFIALPKHVKKAQLRFLNEKRLEIMAGIVEQFLPGCKVTMRIPKARIPIIKFKQDFTNIKCDISMGNMSGIHMSELLYVYSFIDPRVRPLVFSIRHWARRIGITQKIPGAWITNFSLTLLVLAFLQNPIFSPPVLPPLEILIKSARNQDEFLTEDGINCTFLRDINKLQFRTKNTENLETLLLQFFQFYSLIFNFERNVVSLNMPTMATKPNLSPLYIVNPLEHNMNVAKNVNGTQLDKFKVEARKAADVLLFNKTSFFNLNKNKQRTENLNFKFNTRSLFEKNVNKRSYVVSINK